MHPLTYLYDRTLKWRRIYALPIYIFPVCATSLLMGMVVKFDAAKPADGLHCTFVPLFSESFAQTIL